MQGCDYTRDVAAYAVGYLGTVMGWLKNDYCPEEAEAVPQRTVRSYNELVPAALFLPE